MSYQLINIAEVIYSVGNLEKTHHFFCDYGGMTCEGKYHTDPSVIQFWGLEDSVSAQEELIVFDHHKTGQLRLIKFEGVEQEIIRSSQQPWDVGGIMDINLRVPEVAQTFNELRELGWHGLSDPLFQKMGPFELYDILMRGYDDVIIAFTHRKQPPLELKDGYKIPSHVYNSSITSADLTESRAFYQNKLGFHLLNEYEVAKDHPQENMFGLPHNTIVETTCEANIFSLNGERDVIFQAVEFHGVSGKDNTARGVPPNIGWLMYRCEVKGLSAYRDQLTSQGVQMHKEISTLEIKPYGTVQSFAIISPEGVWWEFFEKA